MVVPQDRAWTLDPERDGGRLPPGAGKSNSQRNSGGHVRVAREKFRFGRKLRTQIREGRRPGAAPNRERRTPKRPALLFNASQGGKRRGTHLNQPFSCSPRTPMRDESGSGVARSGQLRRAFDDAARD